MNRKNQRRPGVLLWDAVRQAFHKPATVAYPQAPAEINAGCRGLLQYRREDCIGCGLCMRDCPTGAISVKNHGTKEEKDMRAELDTGRCVFCGQCADSCPRKCLSFTNDVFLAKKSRNGLRVGL